MADPRDILLVDDDDQMHYEVPKMLEGQGLNISHSFTFQDAVMKLATYEPSVVVTDIEVGERTAQEIIRICATYRPNTKVVVLVASFERMMVASELQSMGVHAIVTKPMEQEDLFDAFEGVVPLTRPQTNDDEEEPPFELNQPSQTFDSVNEVAGNQSEPTAQSYPDSQANNFSDLSAAQQLNQQQPELYSEQSNFQQTQAAPVPSQPLPGNNQEFPGTMQMQGYEENTQSVNPDTPGYTPDYSNRGGATNPVSDQSVDQMIESSLPSYQESTPSSGLTQPTDLNSPLQSQPNQGSSVIPPLPPLPPLPGMGEPQGNPPSFTENQTYPQSGTQVESPVQPPTESLYQNQEMQSYQETYQPEQSLQPKTSVDSLMDDFESGSSLDALLEQHSEALTNPGGEEEFSQNPPDVTQESQMPGVVQGAEAQYGTEQGQTKPGSDLSDLSRMLSETANSLGSSDQQMDHSVQSPEEFLEEEVDSLSVLQDLENDLSSLGDYEEDTDLLDDSILESKEVGLIKESKPLPGSKPKGLPGNKPMPGMPGFKGGGLPGSSGGFPSNQQGGFAQPEQGGFPQSEQGGFPQPEQGGFPQPEQGGFPQPEQGGFPQSDQGGFPQPEQSGFAQPEQGGFPQPEQGGFPQSEQGGFPQAEQGGVQQHQGQQFDQLQEPAINGQQGGNLALGREVNIDFSNPEDTLYGASEESSGNSELDALIAQQKQREAELSARMSAQPVNEQSAPTYQENYANSSGNPEELHEEEPEELDPLQALIQSARSQVDGIENAADPMAGLSQANPAVQQTELPQQSQVPHHEQAHPTVPTQDNFDQGSSQANHENYAQQSPAQQAGDNFPASSPSAQSTSWQEGAGPVASPVNQEASNVFGKEPDLDFSSPEDLIFHRQEMEKIRQSNEEPAMSDDPLEALLQQAQTGQPAPLQNQAPPQQGFSGQTADTDDLDALIQQAKAGAMQASGQETGSPSYPQQGPAGQSQHPGQSQGMAPQGHASPQSSMGPGGQNIPGQGPQANQDRSPSGSGVFEREKPSSELTPEERKAQSESWGTGWFGDNKNDGSDTSVKARLEAARRRAKEKEMEELGIKPQEANAGAEDPYSIPAPDPVQLERDRQARMQSQGASPQNTGAQPEDPYSIPAPDPVQLERDRQARMQAQGQSPPMDPAQYERERAAREEAEKRAYFEAEKKRKLEEQRKKLEEIEQKKKESAELLNDLSNEMEYLAEESAEIVVDENVADKVQVETVKERKEREVQEAKKKGEEPPGQAEPAQKGPEEPQRPKKPQYPPTRRPQDPYLRVVVSHDSVDADLVCYPHESDLHQVRDVQQEFEKQGITYGIDFNRVAALLEKVNKNREPVLGETVARGKAPVDGRDAEVKFEFQLNKEVRIKEDESGKVDYRSVYMIDSVHQGDLLATVVPTVPPQDGMSVFGGILQGKAGKDARIMAGRNVIYNQTSRQFYAEIAGQPMLKGNKILVAPIYTVPHDVDLSTGNVEFVGTVIVNGNVKSGFSVTATEDVRVMGLVEAATIKAGGEVFVKQGFTGMEKGVISADKKVTVKFCESGRINCEGDVWVEDSILNSHVSCKGRLRVVKNKGSIIGGQCRAVQGIQVVNLGSEFGVATGVAVGEHFIIGEMLKEINHHAKLNNEKVKKIRMGINTFTDTVRKGIKLGPAQIAKIGKLKEILKVLTVREQGLKDQKNKLLGRFNEKCSSKIYVKQNVFPNVKIQIGNSILKVQDVFVHCSFAEDKFKSAVRLGGYDLDDQSNKDGTDKKA